MELYETVQWESEMVFIVWAIGVSTVRRCTWLVITLGCFLSRVQVLLLFDLAHHLTFFFFQRCEVSIHFLLMLYVFCLNARSICGYFIYIELNASSLTFLVIWIRHMLTIVDNEEFYEQEKPLSLKDIQSLIIILRQVNFYWKYVGNISKAW